MSERADRDLARRAGLLLNWSDCSGKPQRVSTEAARRILRALGYPADTEPELKDSAERLTAASDIASAMLVTATVGEPIALALKGHRRRGRVQLIAEDGAAHDATLQPAGRGRFVMPAIETPGYYRLQVDDAETSVAVAPRSCRRIGDIANGRRLWGLAVQTYSIRRRGDGGIGDTAGIAIVAKAAAGMGADALALSPAHALFPADLTHFSPYSPSSRLFLNPLLADPSVLFGDDDIAAAMREAGDDSISEHLENGVLVDWPAAGKAKLELFRRLFDRSRERLRSGPHAEDFKTFCDLHGELLVQHATFEVLHAVRFEADPGAWNWRNWPEPWRNPGSRQVQEFAAKHGTDIGFHIFLQWLAERAFAQAQTQAQAYGMHIGLVADIAIGMDSGGSHAWSRQKDLLVGLSIGAPPDLYNAKGQNWGLTAFSPQALQMRGFSPFLATLRAAMRHSGGVRIDHIMGLTRLWLIPDGAEPHEGAYLTYPLDDQLRLIALESHRHDAIVIGEDLGTVPDGFRERLDAAGIAGMQVLWFEKEKGGKRFQPSEQWRADAVAMTSTHDLPTVSGWWRGADIEARASVGILEDGGKAEREARAAERAALWDAFVDAGIAVSEPMPPGSAGKPVVDAATAFIARTPATLALVPIEDLLGLDEQPNIPGTTDEFPNWRRRLPGAAENLLSPDPVKARMTLLRQRGDE